MSSTNCYHSWVEINQEQLLQNVAIIRSMIGSTQLGVVIKSNAYGHGIANVAKIIQNSDQVDWAVAVRLSEALQAREAGFTKPILVCGYVDRELIEAIRHRIDLILYDRDSLQRYLELARLANCEVYVHLKVDTGLTRLGFTPDEALAILQELRGSRKIVVRGLYSHFSESDAEDSWYTAWQQQQFENLLIRLEQVGIVLPILHLANTVATFRFPSTRKGLVRTGGGIYGLLKTLPVDSMPPSYWKLQPIISWKTKIVQIREVAEQTYIGYGRTFQANKTMKIAAVPVGYSDGYGRELSNNSVMVVNGVAVPVVGRVGMNMTMIDVTNASVKLGDEVCLLGNVDGIRVTDLMNRLNAISYEVTIRINWTIPRITI